MVVVVGRRWGEVGAVGVDGVEVDIVLFLKYSNVQKKFRASFASNGIKGSKKLKNRK